MNLVSWFVENPVKVWVAVLLLVLFGGVALLGMPMQLTPEVQVPTLTIETRWRGHSSFDVEREIIQEQEEQLKSVEGVVKMTSESTDSAGTIKLEFAVGTRLEEALLKVNTRLQQVREYPIDADEPVISTSNSSDRPIAWFILTPQNATQAELEAAQAEFPALAAELETVKRAAGPGLAVSRIRRLAEKHPELAGLLPPPVDVTKMRNFCEDVIEARFERVDGVSNANVIGGLDEELQVVVDAGRLADRRLSIEDLRRALVGQNFDTSGGDYWEGKRRYPVRVLGQFRSPAEVLDVVIAEREGRKVYVRDVAEVRPGFHKPDGIVRRYGTSCIAINALRETGANVLDVMAGLQEAMRELNETSLAQNQLVLSQVYDETEYIYAAVGLVNENIILGSALTMIVLMFFLHLGVRSLVAAPLVAISALAAVAVSPWFFAVALALILVAGLWFARGALVVSLAIPISIVGTFLAMQLWGRSLNVISLAGIAFAVGMLVDNAVVVLENIYVHYQAGRGPHQAAVRGASEVWGAVVASTLTTLAVFVPVLYVEQEAGQLFRDIALAISAGVALSMIVSIIVIPTAAARLLEDRPLADASARAELMSGIDQFGGSNQGWAASAQRMVIWPIQFLAQGFVAQVINFNRLVLVGTLRKAAVVGVVLSISVLVSWALLPRLEYLPAGNRNLVFGIVLPPPGYNLDQLVSLGQVVEDELRPYWDIDPDSPAARELDFPPIADFFFVARGRQVFIGLRAADATRARDLQVLLGGGLNPRTGQPYAGLREKLPGTFLVAKQASLFEQGLTAGRTVEIEITGPELEKLVGLGGRMMGQLGSPANPDQQLVRGAQAIPKPSLDLSSPEMHVTPRKEQAAELGLSAAELGYAINALVDGAYASDYYQGGNRMDLVITGRETDVRSGEDLAALSLATPEGGLVPLSSVATVGLASGPEQVNHRERQRAITIEVSPPAEVPLEAAMDLIRANIVEPMRTDGSLAGGYLLTLAGTSDKLADAWSALRGNLLLALLITYLLMAALFESWMYPLVIILTVPLGAVGGFLGLWLLNIYLALQGLPPQQLDVVTMLGFIVLIGTVVNNPILIVHQSLNYVREQGFGRTEAVLESCRTRIRPIFMTTLTTVFGLAPLVLFPGAGSELYRGMGAVLLGGLLVSTVLTLVLVPTVFSLALDLGDWLFARPDREPRPSRPLPEPASREPASQPA